MTLASATRLGPYEIVSKIGSGGMGEVYRARDLRLDRDVAIKVLPEAISQDAQALARFQREAKAEAALSHPNVLAVYDIGTEQGRTFVVMELLEGQTLADRLHQSVLDWRSALAIATAIADGLAAAHGKGIVHRDLKPANIFLTNGGGVKILDFGLARLTAQPANPSAAGTTVNLETQPGAIMGTVYYMAPEQVRGLGVDVRSDVFAFGCVLYEMLTGRRPFEGQTSADVMAAVLHQAPAALSQSGSGRPAALERLLHRCLEKDPARRFPSAREVAQALREVTLEPGPFVTGRHPAAATNVQEPPTVTQTLPPAGPSVAVLPFINMSSDKENEFFSDGLAEELISVLTKIEGLHVASRTSAFAFKGKSEDVRKIGEQLSVRTVLEGSVRKSGNRLRISARLVNVTDGFDLWSDTFNRQMEDVFEIQDEIARSIADAVGVLLKKEDQRSEKPPTPDVEAYQYYLRGRQFFHQFRRKGFEFAQQMFAKAIEIDPRYARAYAGTADCSSFLYLNWDRGADNLRKADEASRKALELDPDLAEARGARGLAFSLQKRFAEARQEFETALRLDPTLFEARYFYGRACLAEGKLEDAAAQFEEACRLRPDDYQAACNLTSVYTRLLRPADALAASRRCLHVVDKHITLHPDDARAFYMGALVLSRLGETARALQWADRALALDPEEPLTLYNVACLYSLLGQVERSLDCLERAILRGYHHKAWIENDADLDALRGQPRFQALLEKL